MPNLSYFNFLAATETSFQWRLFSFQNSSISRRKTRLNKFSAVANNLFFSATVFLNESEISSFISVLMTSYKVIKSAAGKCNLATILLNLPFTFFKPVVQFMPFSQQISNLFVYLKAQSLCCWQAFLNTFIILMRALSTKKHVSMFTIPF